MLNYHRERFRKLTTVSLETRNPSLNLRGKYWCQFCDVIVSENIRIRPSTRIRNVIGIKNFHSGERIQKFPDLLANSPYACGR